MPDEFADKTRSSLGKIAALSDADISGAHQSAMSTSCRKTASVVAASVSLLSRRPVLRDLVPERGRPAKFREFDALAPESFKLFPAERAAFPFAAQQFQPGRQQEQPRRIRVGAESVRPRLRGGAQGGEERGVSQQIAPRDSRLPAGLYPHEIGVLRHHHSRFCHTGSAMTAGPLVSLHLTSLGRRSQCFR
jgi:hypothetical protein